MSGAIIVLFICMTVLGIAIIVSRTIENIQTHDSYWKVKYELEKSDMHSILDLNEDIARNTEDVIRNTKDVIKVNEKLTGMLKAYYKEKETPTNEAAE